jgi:hypothetical protein
MADYDVPWKEILDAHLSDFLELCLPQIYDGIDWAYPLKAANRNYQKCFLTVWLLAELRTSFFELEIKEMDYRFPL